MVFDDYFPWNNWFVNFWLFWGEKWSIIFPSNIGSENWWFITNDLFQFLIFAMIVTIKPFKDDQSISGDGIDRSQSSHWNLQICTLTLSGIFVTKNWKKDIGNNFLKVLQYLYCLLTLCQWHLPQCLMILVGDHYIDIEHLYD